ncbi:MAG: hypothetical protein ABFQ95_02050 [Pseudomonadota bacterium]
MTKKRILKLLLILLFLGIAGSMIWIHQGAVLSGILTDYGIEPYEVDSECDVENPTKRHTTTFGQ